MSHLRSQQDMLNIVQGILSCPTEEAAWVGDKAQSEDQEEADRHQSRRVIWSLRSAWSSQGFKQERILFLRISGGLGDHGRLEWPGI